MEGFESDQDSRAAGRGDAVEERLVARDVDADLAEPAALQRGDGVEEREELRSSSEQIVINKEEEPVRRQFFDLVDQAVERADAQRRAVEAVDRAEVAGEAASAAVLDELQRRVFLAFVDGAVEAVIGEGLVVAACVNAPHRAAVGKQALPRSLGVTDDDGVGVPQRLLGEKRRVVAAHHHRNAACAIVVGDGVGAARGEGLDAERGEVGRVVFRQRLGLLVVEGDVPSRRARGEDAHGQRRHGVGGAIVAEVGADEGEPGTSGAPHPALRATFSPRAGRRLFFKGPSPREAGRGWPKAG